ncbi:hypothetical protein HA402_016223 [Bradysia odoriphaga]|nr:hypothetical protein HA402_016223 [Bradysia odoriphaga]
MSIPKKIAAIHNVITAVHNAMVTEIFSNNFNKTVEEKPDWKPFEKNFYKPLDIIHPKEDIDNFIRKHKITINGPAPAPILSFDEVCFPDYIQNKLTGKDFTTPTPIQSQCWPIALSGQNLVGVAQTGSGKTLGYILPAIVHIKNQEELKRADGPIALVLAPTRELAQQIQRVANEFGKPCNVRNACVFGGAGKGPQVHGLHKGSEIVIATPGRLIDFLDSGKPKQSATKTPRPQPLIITDKNCKIDTILPEIGIVNFNCKMMSIGTKVFVNDDNDFNKISSHLKANNIDHFTYAAKDKKICKVVLSGLPVLPIELLKSDLAQLNIQPEQIVQMTTKIQSPHRALYLIHLNGNETTFQDVQKIKSICHTIVKWSMFKPRFKGPTQCRNCGMYGHGTRNCHRKPCCVLCASNEHNQYDCPLTRLPKDSSPVYKCSYCINNKHQPTNHRADDQNCPARKVYTDARKNTAPKQDRFSKKVITDSSMNQKAHQSLPAPIPPPLQRSFRDVVATAENVQPNIEISSSSEELFTTAELFRIFTNAIDQIRNCKSKLDQIQVISNLLCHVV